MHGEGTRSRRSPAQLRSPSTSLTTLGTNNTGGTSSLSFLEILANTVTAPTRSFTSSVSANSVLIRLVVRP